jgi:hypothetical protein
MIFITESGFPFDCTKVAEISVEDNLSIEQLKEKIKELDELNDKYIESTAHMRIRERGGVLVFGKIFRSPE